jgi:hypothetical protein
LPVLIPAMSVEPSVQLIPSATSTPVLGLIQYRNPTAGTVIEPAPVGRLLTPA